MFAVLVAATGLYGWMSYMVEQRTYEIGIRLALGATTGDVLRLLSTGVAGIAVVGIATGTAMFFAAARIFDAVAFDVSARDPVSLLSSIAVVAATALVAAAQPAVRAALISPAHAFRAE